MTLPAGRSPGRIVSAGGQSNGHAGMVGNERLTALAGAVLLALFLIEVITVPPLRPLLSVHFFVGVLLVGPLAVKTGSTGWRFVRYYTKNPAYRQKGPPHLLLRVLAPVLLASTFTLIGSGIALAATGPAPQILIVVHVISFVFWLAAIIIHLIAYVWRVPGLIADDWRTHPIQLAPRSARGTPVRGLRLRLAVNIAALVAATVAALLLLPTTSSWVPWLTEGAVTPLQVVLGGSGILALVGAVVAGWLRRAAR